MIVFLVRRIVAGLVLVLVIATTTFALMGLTGSDPVRQIVGQTATQQQVTAKSAELGLDQPFVVRYGHWLADAVHGNLGSSWFSGESVTSSLENRLPVTLSIVLAALLVSAVLSTVLGVAAAVRRGALDQLVQLLAVLGFAVPSFLVALVFAVVIGVDLGWLPATGYVPLADSAGGWLGRSRCPRCRSPSERSPPPPNRYAAPWSTSCAPTTYAPSAAVASASAACCSGTPCATPPRPR